MKTPTLRFLFHVAAICLLVCPASNGVLAADINAERMALERRYTTPHSLGDNYLFDPRDGWQSVNTTNLLYKYQSRAPVPDSARDDLDDADHLDPTGGTGDTGDNDDELGPRAAEHHHSYTHGTADMRLLPRAGAEHRRHTYTHGTADMQLLPRTDADEHHHTYTHGTGGMLLLPRAKKAHSKC
ncbi:hypothetical protein BD309DRAFT_1076385 [Dichomitus squalens]|uniref:Uncharacterized protein n=1 Tax=Dichomitus squalens TaxID=114155 RepID=A0A4Q9P9E6_9APHY|nr:hypothetical protein BD309DRAFT_1076385 [Dichomitus squalens]TBU59167.1 hypothetical protein BD310DRAFT_1038744 [Dichomitus squalens]